VLIFFLCQAFILYRQHHQANIVAQNPGLANPEISKIIGEQWRTQPEEVKNEWKQLAEVRSRSFDQSHNCGADVYKNFRKKR